MHLTVVLAALAAVVIWGGSAVAAKISVATMAPLTVAVLRTALGGLVALPLALMLRIPLPSSARQRYLLLLSGFCGFVGFPLLFTWGLAHTSANHASMILAALPVFTGAIAATWNRRRLQSRWWLGCAIALAGEFLLISSPGSAGDAGASVYGDTLVLASNLFASLGYVAGGRLQQQGYPAVGTTFWGAALYALPLLLVVPLITDTAALNAVATEAWLGLAYLAVGVTIVGYMCWYWALGKGGIERVGLFQFLQPVSGVVLAWVLLNEYIDTYFVLASILVLSGVWVALRGMR